ncbi:MAG: hypothetical protein QXN26_02550 [Thermoplasmataceae archaeon]
MKSKYVPVSEAYEILSKSREHTPPEADNLAYCEAFLKVKAKDAQKDISELMKTYKLSEKTAVKLVDLRPKTREEAVSILSGYSVILSEQDLNNLISYFSDD